MTIKANEYYTLQEYADAAKITYSAAKARVKARKVPGAVKLHGGNWRIPGTALLDFYVSTQPARTRKSTRKIEEQAIAEMKAAV